MSVKTIAQKPRGNAARSGAHPARDNLSAVHMSNDCFMRRRSITAVVLILVIASLAPMCVAGVTEQSTLACPRADKSRASRRQPICKTATPSAKVSSKCADTLRPELPHCGFCTFLQLQAAEFRGAELPLPLTRQVSKVFVEQPVIRISSIGSPETDRGPPRS
jgi:hypothetical protein